MHEAKILQPDWGKIAKHLGFKQGQTTASDFLEGWRTYAQNSQPSWKSFSLALSNIKDYKQVVKKIQENAGMCVYLNLGLTKWSIYIKSVYLNLELNEGSVCINLLILILQSDQHTYLNLDLTKMIDMLIWNKLLMWKNIAQFVTFGY